MSSARLRLPSSALVSLLAALTTWIALWAWADFTESASGFLVPCLGAALLVAVSGMLMRSARVPTALVPVGQVAVLLVWLSHSWAGELTIGGWIPTAESIREIGLRVQDGVVTANSFAAPVPETAPAIYALLIVAGAGTAVVVDFLACGLRMVPIAGLPLLAIYTAPVSILDGGVSWWGFVFGALSFLMLMAADQSEKLMVWGRQISGDHLVYDTGGNTVSTAALRSSARKIGFTATGLAVVIPVFIPTLSESLFGDGGSGGGGSGDAVSISNPMVNLQRDLTRGKDIDLLTVTTTDPDPSYLRILVLDAFDGATWKPSVRKIPDEQRAQGRMPRPPGLDPTVARTLVPYQIDISPDFRSRWLPTPYPVYSIDADGDWRYDTATLDFISAVEGQTTNGMSYTLEALKVEATAQSLAAAGPTSEEIFTPYTTLPSSVPDMVRDLAREVTGGDSGRFAKVVRLQQWFREDGGFTYSLEPSPGHGNDALEEFLGTGPDSRTGYCAQFAAAMAVMARSIGIPSRVAMGFLEPENVGDNRFVYSRHDLHTWPEVYFEGAGWVRFEPTPPDRAVDVPGYTTGGVPGGVPTPAASSRNPNQDQNSFDDRESAAPRSDDAEGGAGSGGPVDTLTGSGGALAVLVLLVVLAAPWFARWWLRRRRWNRATGPVLLAEAAWGELRDSALDLGLPWDDSVTLRTRARSLATSFGVPGGREDEWTGRPITGPTANPDANQALLRLVDFVERARYAPTVATQDVSEDVELCVRAMGDGASRRRRLVATLLPTSLIRTLGSKGMRGRSAGEGPVLSEPGMDRAI